MLQLPIYLDYNATTPCDPRVVEAMLPFYSRHYGNAASRDHSFGWEASEAVQIARESIAALIGAEHRELIFTSGATEAVNLALKGVYEMYAAKGKHIITVETEHSAVLESCKHLEKMGAEVSYLPVDRNGILALDGLEAAIRPDTLLIAVMYANNETGVIQPVKQIAAIAKKHGVLFFSDATQAVGKIPVNVLSDGIDLMAFSAHKIYGPKGVGALYLRRKQPRVNISRQIDGGSHEKGWRGGTLNVPGIVGFGKAAEICREVMANEAEQIQRLRHQLENGLAGSMAATVNGQSAPRLPNVSNISFQQVTGKGLIAGINKQIAVSTGSACLSETPEPSHVLKAMGLSDELAFSAIRFSLGRFTTQEEIAYTIERVREVIGQSVALTPAES